MLPVDDTIMRGCKLVLILLQRFAEMLCTLGSRFQKPSLHQIGAELWNFVEVYRAKILVQTQGQEFSKLSGENKVATGRIAIAHDTLSGTDIDFSEVAVSAVASHERRLDEILSSNLFDEIIRRAAAIEPAIGVPKEIKSALLPPYSDGKRGVYRQLCNLIPAGKIDTLVCVPWIRVGGADLVACLLADAIKKISPGGCVVILRLDQPNLERKDWIPEGVHAPDLSAALRWVTEEEAEFLLYRLFLGINPKRIVNVNSRLCWKAFQRFGARLSKQVSLYGYFFCWDRSPSGARVGYPTEFFPTTAHFMSGIFTDTCYLRDELIQIYKPPSGLRERISVLRSPVRLAEPWRPMAIETAIETSARRARSKILWAGRLDRQKRFDLVVQTAQMMPDVDFACWGEALLDRPTVKASSLPSNLCLNRNFGSFDELPLASSDCWLFTSDWEGMPTLLIELAMRGIAIVATAVGGVPELIDITTGWPVAPGSGAEVYVQVIRTALSDPKGRVARARELQNRVAGDYTQNSYRAKIDEVFSKAERSIGNITNLNTYTHRTGEMNKAQTKVDQS